MQASTMPAREAALAERSEEKPADVRSAAFNDSGRFIWRLKTPQGRKSLSGVMSETALACMSHHVARRSG